MLMRDRQGGNLDIERFRSNMKQVDGNDMVFNNISYLNHDCIPNVFFHWNATKGVGLVHALRLVILKGTEITVAYCDFGYNKGGDDCYRLLKARRTILKQGWDFICKCHACGDGVVGGTPLSRAEEDRRTRMMTVVDDIEAWLVQHPYNDTPYAFQQMGRYFLLDANLMMSCSVYPDRMIILRMQYEWYHDAFHRHAREGRTGGFVQSYANMCKDQAIEYAEKYLEAEVVARGGEGKEVAEALEALRYVKDL